MGNDQYIREQQYTHEQLSPDEINDLVHRYNNGDSAAIGKLISIFDPFIRKWVSVVKYGAMNLLDPTVARYIALFNCKNTNEYIDNVVSMLYNLDDDDVYNELVILFMYTAKKYRYNGTVYFTGYLNSVFMYRVYRWVSGIIRSMRAETGAANNHDGNNDAGAINTDAINTGAINSSVLDNHIFDVLTPKEKNIIMSIMINGIDKASVASMYGVTVRRIDDMISRAKQKIISAASS